MAYKLDHPRHLLIIPRTADLGERSEGVVVQHVHSSVIRPQVVHLLVVQRDPHILADELDSLQGVRDGREWRYAGWSSGRDGGGRRGEPRSISREPASVGASQWVRERASSVALTSPRAPIPP